MDSGSSNQHDTNWPADADQPADAARWDVPGVGPREAAAGVYTHPLQAAVAQIESALDQAGAANAWTMTPSQVADTLPMLTRAKARVAELELRLVVQGDRAGVGDLNGNGQVAAWWAAETRQTHRATAAALRLGKALDAHEPTRTALATGQILVDQAHVITDALDALPTDLVTATQITQAEATLIRLAADHDAKHLRILGKKILEVIAPDAAEEHLRRELEREEQQARAAAMFTIRSDGQGSMTGRFKIPTLAGEILSKHLNAIAAPKHQRATHPDGHIGPRVARPLRMGQAFTEYIETRARTGTPKAGGLAATVAVTMSLQALLGAEQAATLDTGEPISAATARRLACEAGIIPAVLGGPSQILDLGRTRRFHSEPQRIAISIRDGGCTEKHCDWPPGMCHIHHNTPWSRGGDTNLDDAMMLCPRHHTLAHDARYQLKTDKHGKVTFTRRT